LVAFTLMAWWETEAQTNAASTTLPNSISQQPSSSPQFIQNQLLYAQSIFGDSLTKSLKIVEKNLAFAIKAGYENEEALALQILGDFNIALGNFQSAIKHLSKSKDIYLKLADKPNSIEAYLKLGDAYAEVNQSQNAITQYQKGEKIAGQLSGSASQVIDFNLKIGDEYLKLKNFNNAKIFFNRALVQAEQINYTAGEISATIGLGKVAENTGATTSAEHLFQTANVQAVNTNSIDLTNTAYNSLANLYQNSNNNAERLKIQEKAIDLNVRAGKPDLVVQNSTKMAKILLEEGQDDKALEVLNQSANLIKSEANSEVKRAFYKTLSEAYKEKGDLNKSKEIEKEYVILMDSFKLLEAQKSELVSVKNEIIQNTENKISLLEKDRELNEKTIQLLQQQKLLQDKSLKNQQNIMVFLVIGLLLVATIIFFVFRSNKQKHKNNQLLTLKSLRNQMNPHFIFNSLNSVNVYIAQQDERAANKYLADFSKLMRAVLNYSQNDFIPLSKELEILTLYLNLEHDRFKEHFDFTINCPENLNLEQYQIPPMLIQPLVENAIWHGLRYKKEKGFLNVDFLFVNEGLKIIVTDNGIGRSASLKQKTANQLKMKSTGIKNVVDRLDIIRAAFKQELTITITDLNEDTKEGTVATVLLKS
jgi:tetratricopeptide (TPR) repeat protein